MKAICPGCGLEMRVHFGKGDGRNNKHHIIPRSKLDGRQIPHNTVRISGLEHEKYHHLFENKTPDEILSYLVETFWGGQLHLVKDFVNRH
jgi:hypothetical protein